ncbi:MAG: GDSL family lipase, partial [Acidobacteriota bacterium]|nr:GDSL family lipase [Acidobacteriota bacterium]
GSLPGLGEETEEIDNQLTGQHETVHTFGWYMRKMVRETREKGATPILFSLTVRNVWKNGHVERGSGSYGEWSRELAKAENIAFVDLTNLAADRYESMGEETVGTLFPKDHTHTNDAGAELNAELVLAGLKCMRENAIVKTLSAKGRAVEIAPFGTAILPRLTRPAYSLHDEFMRWLNLPDPAEPGLRSLFLIGDSTVRNGRGDGVDGPGQWGWGDPLAAYFDPAKINVVNRAVGGTGVQSFMAQGYWDMVLAMLKPGDVVIMQFGHNDNGPKAPLRGTGDQTEMRQGAGGASETEHTWGWYLRKYIADARAKGAIPIVCTLIPRNTWQGSRVARQRDQHADWARAVAAAERAPLLDLNEHIAAVYDGMGEARVAPLFADGKVHTSKEGAELNAQMVVSSLKGLRNDPLAEDFRPTPAKVW